jgi:hypothetical protein
MEQTRVNFMFEAAGETLEASSEEEAPPWLRLD